MERSVPTLTRLSSPRPSYGQSWRRRDPRLYGCPPSVANEAVSEMHQNAAFSAGLEANGGTWIARAVADSRTAPDAPPRLPAVMGRHGAGS